MHSPDTLEEHYLSIVYSRPATTFTVQMISKCVITILRVCSVGSTSLLPKYDFASQANGTSRKPNVAIWRASSRTARERRRLLGEQATG